MIHSFRLRLALWSALLAGVALASFAAAALWQMRGSKIDALDRAIRDQAGRELSRSWPPEHWPRHEQHMGHAFGTQSVRQSLLLVQDREGLVYRSGHWPAGLDADALPWPQAENLAAPEEAAADFDVPPPPGRPPPFPPPRRPGQTRLLPPPEGPEEFPPPEGPGRGLPPPAFATLSLAVGGEPWRFGLAATPHGKIAVGVNLAVVNAEMAELRNAFLLALPLALAFIGLGAGFLSGRALAPLHRLTATMEAVTAKGLDQRIALGEEDREFRQLIQVFNGMLGRLERSFLQASRFSGDAAHELKTPLAILQGQIERAIAQCEAGSPLQERLTGILDEVQRLSTISRKLLLLSLADAGRLRLHWTRLDLSQALQELVEDAQMLAPGLEVTGSVEPGLSVEADVELLRQVLHNLLSNAIKYNRPQGWIKIAAARRAGVVAVSVSNASPGIPHAERERIFERFYRADSSRNRRIEGVGLGLSLSREIARAHGGDLLLAEPQRGETQFVLVLAKTGGPRRSESVVRPSLGWRG